MVSEERPDRQEEGQELAPVDSQEVVAVEVGEPTVPQGISEEEREELGKRAQELVRELSNAEGAKERELIKRLRKDSKLKRKVKSAFKQNKAR